MPTFKNINYPYQLIDTLRSYFAINSEGNLSILYKICLSVIYPFQGAFDDYDLFRRKMLLIANCKWQIGQVENLLNYLFDPTYNRIAILQNTGVTQKFVRNFDLLPIITPVYARNFDLMPVISAQYMPNFDSIFINTNQVQIRVPFYSTDTILSEIIAVINMIRLKGTTYKLITL